jgi:hypothetical protein
VTRAEDAIAEVLHSIGSEWIYDSEVERALAMWDPRPLAAKVIAAIRDLSADDLAEMIGGEVRTYDFVPGQARVVGPCRPTDGLSGAGAATGAPEAATDAQGPA